MPAPRILVLAASTRTGSYNRSLAELACRKLEAAGAEVTYPDLRNYRLPVYDADQEKAEGLPEAARKLHALFRSHDGIFIASPEYSANVSPLLVNLLAWVSRIREDGGMAAAFRQPVFALGSASPGTLGGYRGLIALRNSLELQLMARVLPEMVSVAAAHEAFDEQGELRQPALDEMLTQLVHELVAATTPRRVTMAVAGE